MQKAFLIVVICMLVGSAFATPGNIIGSGFSFGVVRGLDRDWVGDWVWMISAVANNCQIGKFDAVTRQQVGSWVLAQSLYWCFDCAYGYIYNGTTSIIPVDQNSPRLKVYNPTTGVQLGTLPNAFPEYSYDDGLACYNDLSVTTTWLWASSYNGNPIKKSDYPCTTWSSFATCPSSPVMGLAYCWGKLLAITSSPNYTVYCFNVNTGELESSWPLSSWTSYLMGMSAGRVNAVGPNESVFVATFSPSNTIYEVEIGDVYNDTRIQPTSLGMIKCAYK